MICTTLCFTLAAVHFEMFFAIKKRMSYAKHWVFTSFRSDWRWLPENQCDYFIVGREVCPKTGRKHLQGYVCFKMRKYLTAVKKLEPQAHWEVKRGSVTSAIEYCMKEGSFYEFGTPPIEERSKKDRYAMALKLAEKGDFVTLKEDYPGLYVAYKHTWEGLYQPEYEPLDEPRGMWIVGEPGGGKDTAVIAEYQPFVKQHNKWWDGYKNQKQVLISDVDQNDAKWIGTFLKLWADRYPFDAEVKGGTIRIHPEKLFVTSNYTIESLFHDAKMQIALLRRFDVVDCDGNMIVKKPKLEPKAVIRDLIKKAY